MTANIDGAATPRPELAAHIDAAASAWDSLAASGRRVAFEDTPDRPRQIRLRDDDDNDLGVLTGVELFDLIDQEGKAEREVGERWSAILVPSPAASNTWTVRRAR